MAFEPRESEVQGQQVRNITVQQAGFGPYAVRVGATVWPSHSHVALKQGDVVTLEGSYNKRSTTDNETGEERTFHNVSVTRILVHGAADSGKREETTNDSEPSDDDVTF